MAFDIPATSSHPPTVQPAFGAGETALVELLAALQTRGHRFVAPTPATQARVLARRPAARARDLRDVFGWSLPFAAEDGPVDDALLALMRAAGVVEARGDVLASTVRASSVRLPGGRETLLLHSAYPTDHTDAVFFGPDSYRFAALIEAALGPVAPGGLILDVGAGAGVGGIVAGALNPQAQVLLSDVNEAALRLARVNAAHAGVAVETRHARGLDGMQQPLDAVVINPPYIADEAGRAYRDGGDMHGGRLSLDLAVAAAGRLKPDGRLILYTGAAIVEGRDALRESLGCALAERGCDLRYWELDPDVFGEELERAPYAEVERIALVAAVADKRR